MRKGFTSPVNDLMQWIGLLLICLIMLYIIVQWGSSGAHIQRGLEQGSLMYTIANSANSLSAMEEGEISRQLNSLYDIKVECKGGVCYVTTTPYNSGGELQDESNEVLIMGNIEPVQLKKVNKITLTKERGSKVVLTGIWVEDLYGVELEITKYPARCMSTYLSISEIISDPDINQGEDPELIAAIIEAESSWNQDSYRYEPGYQIRYLEDKESWEANTNWLDSGDTIEQWFAKNPSRSDEKDDLTKEQLGLTAQTELSASYGLMQVMYPTALQICQGLELKGEPIELDEPEDLYDPQVNIFCGVRYIKNKRIAYSDLRDAVSAYNAGKSSWTTNLANRQYTADVLGLYDAYKRCA